MNRSKLTSGHVLVRNSRTSRHSFFTLNTVAKTRRYFLLGNLPVKEEDGRNETHLERFLCTNWPGRKKRRRRYVFRFLCLEDKNL
jgi:hypothetical protein